MSSTARVVSSYNSLTIRASDPRLADDDEENHMTPRPRTCTPQEAFASDLDWDGDELVNSAYPSLQQPEHIFDENHGEAQSTASRIHVRVDERSPLLPRVREEASQSNPPRHSQDSVPGKSTTTGQSTFFQTVSHSLPCLSSSSHLTPRLAFQCYSLVAWHWNALRAPCILLCRVDLRNRIPYPLRLHHMLYVCLSGYLASFYETNGLTRRAKFLAGIVISDPHVRTYADIGAKAFGVRSTPLVNFMFCIETFSVG
jgi:hypothetical protein